MIDVLMCSFYGKAYVVRTYMGLIESQNIYETLSFLFVKGCLIWICLCMCGYFQVARAVGSFFFSGLMKYQVAYELSFAESE